MAKTKLLEPSRFTGVLCKGEAQVDVIFTFGIDETGQADISFERFPRDARSAFLFDSFDVPGAKVTKFRLKGQTAGGMTFDCDNVALTSLGSLLGDEQDTYAPTVVYVLAKLQLNVAAPRFPALLYRIKGFRSFRRLTMSCPLGTVEMAGEIDANNENELSGWLRISPDKDQDNLEEWRSKAEALCRHIRHLMSFGAGVSLSCPIVEFQQDRLVYIDAYSKSQQQPSAFPVFPPMHLDDFFQCVVNSYFDPAVHVEKLTYATQWFTMRSVYRELYLISSMTVLENLIGSNLSEADTLILSKKDFERLRKGLSGVVKEQATDLFDDPEMQKNFIHNLNEGIAGLKRKSLFEKITLLASQWGVDLNDIPKEKIEAAKAARDHVVHRGHYEPKSSSTEDLLDHILTVREIVVRFILTALNFNGRYQSYIYGGDLRKLTKALPATRN